MYIVCIVAIVFLFLLMLPVRVVLEVKDGFSFYGKILFFKIKPPHKKEQEKKDKTETKKKEKKSVPFQLVRKIIASSEDIRNIAGYFASRCVVIENLRLSLAFGLGDAAKTGIATGSLNGVAYTAMGAVHHNTCVKKWTIDISPDFEREKFEFEFLCIGRTRLLHIIDVGIKGLKIYKKFRKL